MLSEVPAAHGEGTAKTLYQKIGSCLEVVLSKKYLYRSRRGLLCA